MREFKEGGEKGRRSGKDAERIFKVKRRGYRKRDEIKKKEFRKRKEERRVEEDDEGRFK